MEEKSFSSGLLDFLNTGVLPSSSDDEVSKKNQNVKTSSQLRTVSSKEDVVFKNRQISQENLKTNIVVIFGVILAMVTMVILMHVVFEAIFPMLTHVTR